MGCAEPENQALARLRSEVVTAESVQLDVVAGQFFGHALEIELRAGHSPRR